MRRQAVKVTAGLVVVLIMFFGCQGGNPLSSGSEDSGAEESAPDNDDPQAEPDESGAPKLHSFEFLVEDNPQLEGVGDLKAEISPGRVYFSVPDSVMRMNYELVPSVDVSNTAHISPNQRFVLGDIEALRLDNGDGLSATYGIEAGVQSGSIAKVEVADPFWIDGGTKRQLDATLDSEGSSVRVVLPPENYSVAETEEILAAPIGFGSIMPASGASMDQTPLRDGVVFPVTVEVEALDGSTVDYTFSAGREAASSTEVASVKVYGSEIADYSDTWEYTNGSGGGQSVPKQRREITFEQGDDTNPVVFPPTSGYSWNELFSDYGSSSSFNDVKVYEEKQAKIYSDGCDIPIGNCSSPVWIRFYGHSYTNGFDGWNRDAGSGTKTRNGAWRTVESSFSVSSKGSYSSWGDEIVNTGSRDITHRYRVRREITGDKVDDATKVFTKTTSYSADTRLRREFSARAHYRVEKIDIRLTQNGRFEDVEIYSPATDFELLEGGSRLLIETEAQLEPWSGTIVDMEVVSEDGSVRSARSVVVVD